MRARSIPEEHEAKVLRLYLAGETHHAIADRLDAEDGVDTSAGSVHRLIERIADGDSSDGVLRIVTKIRLNAQRLADRIARHTMIAHKMGGFDEPVEVPAGLTPQQLDFASRMTLRELKVAGCLGRDVERAFEHARALAEEACQEEEEEMEEIREAARRHLRRMQQPVEATASGPAAIPAEQPAPASESAARPFAQPPPERLRASSNERLSSPPKPGVGSGGGPPCPPNRSGNLTGDHPGSAALLHDGHGGPPPLDVVDRRGDSSAARPIPQPPPERLRASSNERLSSPPKPGVGSGGGLPCPSKQGRNEPCACGSGEKFKRCCGGPNGRLHAASGALAVAG